MANGSLLPKHNQPFIHRGGSTRALDKDVAISHHRQRNKLSGDIIEESADNCNEDENSCIEKDDTTAVTSSKTSVEGTFVTKKDGSLEPLDKDKVSFYIIPLSTV